MICKLGDCDILTCDFVAAIPTSLSNVFLLSPNFNLQKLLLYSRTPLIRPPPESHWCGRIRGMVAHEGFRYAALLQQRHTKYGRMRGMVVGEGGRSIGVLLYL